MSMTLAAGVHACGSMHAQGILLVKLCGGLVIDLLCGSQGCMEQMLLPAHAMSIVDNRVAGSGAAV